MSAAMTTLDFVDTVVGKSGHLVSQDGHGHYEYCGTGWIRPPSVRFPTG
jgi:hypothetical protein